MPSRGLYMNGVPLSSSWDMRAPLQRLDARSDFLISDEGFIEDNGEQVYRYSASHHGSAYGRLSSSDYRSAPVTPGRIIPASSHSINNFKISQQHTPELLEESFHENKWKVDYQFMMQALQQADHTNTGNKEK